MLVGCRLSRSERTAYALQAAPILGTFRLVKDDANLGLDLAAQQRAPTLQRGFETNRLQLTCNGSTISASINGTQVASVQDTSYGSGRIFIGAGVYDNFLPATVDARFANLVLTQP